MKARMKTLQSTAAACLVAAALAGVARALPPALEQVARKSPLSSFVIIITPYSRTHAPRALV